MTCYIKSIDDPESIYTIRIKRFDPERDSKPYWASYQVPFVKTMTVMEALEYLWDQGEYLAFRANCREFTCGSCVMLINGKPRLACDSLLKNNQTLEPLSRFPLIKDLVVDTGAVKRKLKELKYWPVRDGVDRELKVSKQILEEFSQVFSRCIECYCCLEACPASSSESSKFDGPMYLLQVARASRHPLDTMNRIRQASEHGIWNCVSCFECANVCPVNLNPGAEIAKLRKQAVKMTFLGIFGLGKGMR
jgi:succinate dehydrogenase/fumarate reductase iron-sulfur protein